MKRKIIGLIIFIMFLLPVASSSAVSNENAELDIQIYGGLPLPVLIRNVGGVITNIGDSTAYDISLTLSIIGGISGSINITYDGFYEYLEPFGTSKSSLGFFIPNIFGFGVVTITLSASASNAPLVSVKAKGFQFGDITWVPLSWITPPILKGLVPWLDYWFSVCI